MSTSMVISKIDELLNNIVNSSNQMTPKKINDEIKINELDIADFSIVGYIAVVTGAADGIGKGLSYKFAKEGCNLALVDINGDKLTEVAKDLQSLYPTLNITAFKCDVSDEQQVNELVNKVKEAFNTNTIEILFNNAGIYYSKILDGDIRKLKKTMDVNLWSMIYATRAFKHMLIENDPSKQCFIMNNGSIASVMTANTMYAVTKHAVIALTEAIAIELKQNYPNSNICVTALAPLYVKTNLPQNSKKQLDDIKKDIDGESIWNDSNFIQLFIATAIDIHECAQIIYQAMKAKQTVIPTNRAFFEAAIKDRTDSLLKYKPNSWVNWKAIEAKLVAS